MKTVAAIVLPLFLDNVTIFCCNLRKLVNIVSFYEIIDMIKLMKTIFLIFLILTVGGCGIAHVKANVPTLEIRGQLISSGNESAKYVRIVVPEFYGEADAFLTMLKEELSESSAYQWKKSDLAKDGVIIAKVNEEKRYIGFMPPFSPSKRTMEIRKIFIWPEGPIAYRITIYGNDVSAESVNIYALRNSLPVSLRTSPQGLGDGSRVERIKQLIEWYNNIDWCKTDQFQLVEVARNPEFDRLIFELRIN